MNRNTNIELGVRPQPQLYHLVDDLAESSNLAELETDLTQALAAELAAIRGETAGR